MRTEKELHKTTTLQSAINRVVSRFIGAEIISQNNERTEIECITAEQKLDLWKIENRIIYVFKESSNQLLETLTSDFSEFHNSINDHHDNITKFILYYLRTLDKSDTSEDEKKVAYAFYSYLDYLVDRFRELSVVVNKYGTTSKTNKFIKLVFDSFFDSFSFIRGKKEFSILLREHRNLKDKIKKEKFSVNELQIINVLWYYIHSLNFFSAYGILRNFHNIKYDSI